MDKNIKLNIPFIPSRGFECGQACAAMMIKYYYPDFEPNFDKINRLIHHKKGKYTFPPQLSILLNHYGVSNHVYSSDDIKTSAEDPDQFKRWFGKDYTHEMQYVDLPTVDWMATTMRQLKLFKLKTSDFSELLVHFRAGHLIGLPLDWATLTGKIGPYQGHFVIISGLEGDHLLLHDPDIGPYQPYPVSLVQSAWEHPAITDDFLLATGKIS